MPLSVLTLCREGRMHEVIKRLQKSDFDLPVMWVWQQMLAALTHEPFNGVIEVPYSLTSHLPSKRITTVTLACTYHEALLKWQSD